MHGLRSALVEVEQRAEHLKEMEAQMHAAEERLARAQADVARSLEERQRLRDQVAELEATRARAEETERALAEELAELRASRAAGESPGSGRGGAAAAAAADDLRASVREAPESTDREDGSGSPYTDGRFGPLFRTPPAEADDLTELRGVGDIIRNRLNEIGVHNLPADCGVGTFAREGDQQGTQAPRSREARSVAEPGPGSCTRPSTGSGPRDGAAG